MALHALLVLQDGYLEFEQYKFQFSAYRILLQHYDLADLLLVLFHVILPAELAPYVDHLGAVGYNVLHACIRGDPEDALKLFVHDGRLVAALKLDGKQIIE